ncbi:hypothetical protein ACC717_04295 [Rhizobium ruizarguesonis]|uniref:hypothetical protein n=1 Tax=Rhizobium leguminosarum TaxID=384 RepID=UPI001C952B78|nr:hypothetical protein [Rhizobium leguminosarum]MBY5481919.1 hypothetical protein [Rhizobium leguminosarum]
MTICVCVKVHEVMVFAADSATSFGLPGQTDADGIPYQQVYRHGNKLFQLHRQYPIMAMTNGLGSFGQASIAMLAKQFRQMIGRDGTNPLGNDYTIEGVVELAQKFFLEEKYPDVPAEFNGGFEFWIGGYSSGEMHPELWKLAVFQGKVQDPVCMGTTSDVDIYCGGQPDPIFRLVRGYGWKLEHVLATHGVTPETHQALYEDVGPQLYLPLVSPTMPIQDAIDLADFLADMTKKVFRFRAVPEYVSGDIDIATVTKYENFRWIRRKHYYPMSLNQQVDHV